MLLTPLLPRAGPTGGLGLAWPAPTMSFTIWSVAIAFLAIILAVVVDQLHQLVALGVLCSEFADVVRVTPKSSLGRRRAYNPQRLEHGQFGPTPIQELLRLQYIIILSIMCVDRS